MSLQNIDSHMSFNLGKSNYSTTANNFVGNDYDIEE